MADKDFPAGDYELVAPFWEEYTSKPGQPLDFTRHVKGDTVTLNAAEARRLGHAGAIKRKGQVDAAPGSGPSVAPGTDPGTGAGTGSTQPDPAAVTPAAGPASDKIDDIVAYVGTDKDRAEQWLKVEQDKEHPRSTLVEKLEAIITDPGPTS